MTIFLKTKFKKSDDEMNIDKYRVDANITEYQGWAKQQTNRQNHNLLNSWCYRNKLVTIHTYYRFTNIHMDVWMDIQTYGKN